jgi:hypothetical protein
MNMNGAHWHILVNHMPIVGTLMACIVLGFGLLRKNGPVVDLSFGLLILMSIAAFITDQTGGSAAHYLDSIHELNKPVFYKHAEAADTANIAMYITGLASLLALIWERAKRLAWLPTVVFVLSLITFGLMANVGRLGGLIMHKEIRANAPVAPAGGAHEKDGDE